MKTHTIVTPTVLFASLFLLSISSDAFSQTLTPGVYNVPGTLPLIGNNESIGSNTTVNLMDGGSIGEFFQAGPFGTTPTKQVTPRFSATLCVSALNLF